LRKDSDLREVMEGEEGILNNVKNNTIIVDHTTASANIAREYFEICKNRNLHFLDAPVSGGQAGAENGQLSIMVGGETEYGRKRQIDQSNCNKDYSCVNGFCPSFVSVVGDVKLKTNIDNSLIEKINSTISEPIIPEIQQSYGIMIAGIGGTGVVTIGAILATAAQIDGKGSGVLDMTAPPF
jgi:hypothetical protein